METALRVAARPRAIVVAAVFSAEALDRNPCLDQRAVYRELLVRQQPLQFRLSQDRCQELRGDLASSRSRFLEKFEWSQTGSSTPRSTKPAKQKVELQSLHQLTLGANAVKRLQQHRPKQLLADQNPYNAPQIHATEPSTLRSLSPVSFAAGGRRELAPPDPLAEQRSRPFIRTTHPHLPIQSIERIMPKSMPLVTCLLDPAT